MKKLNKELIKANVNEALIQASKKPINFGNVNSNTLTKPDSIIGSNINSGSDTMEVKPLEESTVNDVKIDPKTLKKSSINEKKLLSNDSTIKGEKIDQSVLNLKPDVLTTINEPLPDNKNELTSNDKVYDKKIKEDKLVSKNIYGKKIERQKLENSNVYTPISKEVKARSIQALKSENIVQENINFKK